MPPRRVGRERSRNGCLTCKIRRVKCDETSPHCRKCTETGRKCEGPLVHQYRFIQDQSMIRPANPNPQATISLLAPQHDVFELRAFEYFMHQMAGVFVPAIDAPFWKGLIPCLSQHYSFVWDIVVCCSTLTEYGSYASLTKTYDPTDPIVSREHRQALKYYDRAITNVQQLAQNDQVDDSMIVLSYILFASVEFVQQNVKTGNDLVKRCCKILARDLTSPSDRKCSTASQAIHQVVTPFVLRRAIVIATLGDASQPQGIADKEANHELETVLGVSSKLNQARIEFHGLVQDCYNLIRLADFLPHVKDNDPRKIMFITQRQLLLNGMTQWKASFTTLHNQLLNTETEWVGSYLLMYCAVCYISLAACVSPFETTFDEYMHHFVEIIEHGKICLKHGAETSSTRILPGFDHGVVPPLYFCATKCRHPTLRREALRLLRQTPKSDGLWAFIAPDRVVAKVISAEEGEYQRRSSPDASRPWCTSLPPEERRYAYISVVGRQTPGGKQLQAVEMSRFEYATDESRRLINDYAWLDDTDELHFDSCFTKSFCQPRESVQEWEKQVDQSVEIE